jgi:hypothetical protein
MTGDQIVKAMQAGFTLHSSRFGFWLINPLDAQCTNVHNGAAKALARRKRIKRATSDTWILNQTLTSTKPPPLP